MSKLIVDEYTLPENVHRNLSYYVGSFMWCKAHTDAEGNFVVMGNFRQCKDYMMDLHFRNQDHLLKIHWTQENIDWLTSRNDITVNKTYDLKPMTLYVYDMADRTFKEDRYIEKKQLPVVPGTTGTGNSIIHLNNWSRNAVNEPFKHLFLTELDFKTTVDIANTIERGQLIPVWFTYYDQINERTVKVFANIMNVENIDNVEIQLFCSTDIFKAMDLTRPHYVTITNIINREELCTIYVKDADPISNYYITENDIVMSSDMWRNPNFPAECDICGEVTKFAKMEKSEVLIVNPDSFVLVCPTCSGKGTHV